MMEELNSFQVLIAAKFIRQPLSVLFTVIQIQHGCYCIYTDTVYMELSQPEQSIGYQEVLHFIFAIIKYLRSPFRMFSQTRVGMFKYALSVKFCQSVCIGCKMCRYPVQNDSNACLMQFINQIHKILRRSVTGRRRIVSGHLIPPGAIIRMLCDSHKLYMGVFHLFQIFNDPVGKLPIIIESFRSTVIRMLHERTDMTLIDRHGLLVHIFFIPGFHPLGILPIESRDISNDGRCARSVLRIVSKGIGFVQSSAISRIDQELIHCSFFHAGNEQPPDTTFSQLLHGMRLLVPFIECADDIHLCCIWCPYPKIDSLHTIFRRQMRAQFFINIIVRSLGKKILICFGNKYLLLRHSCASRYIFLTIQNPIRPINIDKCSYECKHSTPIRQCLHGSE